MGSKNQNQHAKLKKLSKFADTSVLVIFFLGFLAFDYEIFGLHEQIVAIPHEMEVYFEFVPWIIFLVLVFDLILKYLILEKNLKIFFQHYWFKIIKTGKFGYPSRGVFADRFLSAAVIIFVCVINTNQQHICCCRCWHFWRW